MIWNIHFQRHTNFLVKLQCSVLKLWTNSCSSGTLVLEGSTINFSSPKKNRQMQPGQNNKYDITKTSCLVHVCCSAHYLLNTANNNIIISTSVWRLRISVSVRKPLFGGNNVQLNGPQCQTSFHFIGIFPIFRSVGAGGAVIFWFNLADFKV